MKINLIPAEILRTLFKLLCSQQKVHYSETGRNAEKKRLPQPAKTSVSPRSSPLRNGCFRRLKLPCLRFHMKMF